MQRPFWRLYDGVVEILVPCGVVGGLVIEHEHDVGEVCVLKLIINIHFDMAQVYNIDVAVVLRQVRHEGVTIGVLDHQNVLILGIAGYVDDGVAVIAHQECQIVGVVGGDTPVANQRAPLRTVDRAAFLIWR